MAVQMPKNTLYKGASETNPFKPRAQLKASSWDENGACGQIKTRKRYERAGGGNHARNAEQSAGGGVRVMR